MHKVGLSIMPLQFLVVDVVVVVEEVAMVVVVVFV